MEEPQRAGMLDKYPQIIFHLTIDKYQMKSDELGNQQILLQNSDIDSIDKYWMKSVESGTNLLHLAFLRNEWKQKLDECKAGKYFPAQESKLFVLHLTLLFQSHVQVYVLE